MTVTRSTIGRIRRQVEAARRSMPPLVHVVNSEPEEGYEARLAEARRELAAVEATGRRTAIIVVDREECEA